MTTEPTDLREAIEAALRAHRPTIVDVCPVEGSVIEVLVSARIDDVIDAVEPIVREEQAEAWGEGQRVGLDDGLTAAELAIGRRLDLLPGPAANPYRQEAAR